MYRVELTCAEDASFKAKSKDYEFIIGTKGKGMAPPDVLLASLGSCIGVYLRKYCAGANLACQDFSITVEADFSQEALVCFREIKVTVNLKGASLDARRKEALVTFIKNCPVHNTLKASPQMEIKIT